VCLCGDARKRLERAGSLRLSLRFYLPKDEKPTQLKNDEYNGPLYKTIWKILKKELSESGF
jgi:hypothetical protein